MYSNSNSYLHCCTKAMETKSSQLSSQTLFILTCFRPRAHISLNNLVNKETDSLYVQVVPNIRLEFMCVCACLSVSVWGVTVDFVYVSVLLWGQRQQISAVIPNGSYMHNLRQLIGISVSNTQMKALMLSHGQAFPAGDELCLLQAWSTNGSLSNSYWFPPLLPSSDICAL